MWQYHPVLLIFQLGVVLSLGVAAYAAYRLRQYGWRPLVATTGLLALHNGIWNLAATIKVASPVLATKLWMYKLEFLGAAFTPSVGLVLALLFLGWRRWLGPGVLGLLIAVPVLEVVLVFTNPGEAVILDPTLVQAGGLQAFEHVFPPVFTGILAWNLGLAILATGLVAYGAWTKQVPRRPGLLVSLAFFLPIAATMIKVLGWYPPGGTGINITPAVNTATLALIAVAIGRYRLFALIPAGRSRVFELIRDGYVLANEAGQIVDVNRSARRMLSDADGTGLIGQLAREVLPIDDPEQAPEPSTFSRGDRTIELQAQPIREGPRRVGTIYLLRDVTELRARERALERENDRLASFAGIVTHDLRNPLNVAQGRLRMMIEERGGETGGNHLAHLKRALGRMEAIIEDVQAMTRGGQTPEPEELAGWDLEEIAQSTWAQVPTEEARLQVEGTRRIRAHEGRLRQLLENLFRNAVEHGGSQVRVRVGPAEEGFFVEDDGPGIPEDCREQVWDPGYSTTEEGTGLGLSIVSSIAEAHGWDLSVRKGQEGGARFVIRGVQTAETDSVLREGT